jgi:predicted ATPase
LQEPPLSVIGIEEPELTVHPGALPLIYDFLSEASERSQIFVTTHSPILLDYINLDRAKVFVVQKENGVSEIKSISKESKNKVSGQLMTLGDMLISDLITPSLLDE